MSYGFVYVLGNPAMRGVYKIGFTNRSPSLRRDELSNGTGVPAPFDLICYAEYENARAREQEIHQFLANRRVSPGREFFRCDLLLITDLVMDVELASSVCEHQKDAFLYEESPLFRRRLLADEIERDVTAMLDEPLRKQG